MSGNRTHSSSAAGLYKWTTRRLEGRGVRGRSFQNRRRRGNSSRRGIQITFRL